MIEIKDNPTMYEICKNILDVKQPREHISHFKVEAGSLYATDGRVLMVHDTTLEDGFYKPVNVTKKVVTVYKVSEEINYPDVKSITETKFIRRFERAPDAVGFALTTGKALDPKYCEIAYRLNLIETKYIDSEEINPVLFSAPGTYFYVMPMKFDPPKIQNL